MQDESTSALASLATTSHSPPTSSEAQDRVGEFHHVADALAGFLRSAGPQPGAVIGSYLRATFGFDPREHGFASMSHFIRAELPEVAQTGKAGMDPIWGVRSTYRNPQQPHEVRSATWRALSSPNSAVRVRVLVNVETGTWRVLETTRQALAADVAQELPREDGAWHHVSPMPAEMHRESAREFLAREDIGPLRAQLGVALEQAGWWTAWQRLLRNQPRSLAAWYEHRNLQVRRYVHSTLERLGVSGAVLEHAMEAVAPEPAARPAEARLAPLGMRNRGSETVRALITRIIANMTDQELEGLQVPLRAVIAALRQR